MMTSLTDKMPVKDFNAIFKNDELAKEISQLIEKAKKPPKIEYRYTKEELLEIAKSPLCKVPKAIFNAKLAEANLSENIIYSLQKKTGQDKNQVISSSQENVNDIYDENGQSYNRYKNNNNNRPVKTRENVDSYRENVSTNPRYDREKTYRSNKISDSEAAQCWRTDKNLNNGNSNRNKRDPYPDRYSQTRKLPYNQRNSYNRNGYRDYEEEEPEWFSNGPESMNDFIDLKGFDDDENSTGENSQENSDKRNSQDFTTNNSGDMHDASKNESFNRNLSDLSSLLNMNVSELFNSPNVSFLENKDINDFPLPVFGDLNSSNSSSRAQKWFKRGNETSGASEGLNVSKTTSPLTVGSEKTNSIMDLFQNAKKLSQTSANMADIKVDMSKATSLADLEANLLNSAPTKKSTNGSAQDSAVLSKLLSLAGQQETKSNNNIQNNNNNGPSNPALPFNINNFMNEHLNKHLNKPNAMPTRPNNATIYPPNDFNQLPIPNMNRMVHPSFLKGPPPPMSSFPFPENMPFNADNMHQRQAPFYPPIPPELAHQFIPPNTFVPGYMPNPPHFPAPLMNHQGALPPHMAAQLLAQYNVMMQSPMMAQDVARSKNEEPNLADKLLKNSKFTPTSVFRKLNDQNKTKPTIKVDQNQNLHVKSEQDIMNSVKTNDFFDMNKDPRAMSMNDPLNMRAQNTIPHPLSNYNQNNDKNVPEMALLFQQFNLNRAPTHGPSHPMSSEAKPNAVSFNPSDIFNVMKKNEHHTANIDLPPLPMKNALKLEDLEKSEF